MDKEAEKKQEEVRTLYENIPYVNLEFTEKYYSPILKSTRLSDFKKSFARQDAVEVGCGGGQISLYLSRYFRTITGIDMSANSIEAAKKRSEPNMTFILGNLYDSDLINRYKGKFDHVFCCGVLHHVPDPEQGLKNIKELAKPGGMLTIALYSTALVDYRIRRKLTLMLAGSDFEKRMDTANRLFHNGKWDRVSLSDAYAHPLVTFWSINKTYEMLKRNGLEYVGSYPPIELSAYPKLMKQKLSGKEIDYLVEGKKSDYNSASFALVEALWVASRLPAMLFITARLKR